MRKRELAGHMQRCEGVMVGSYIDADEHLALGAGAATRRIEGVVCLAARNIDEPFLNRALGAGTIAELTPGLLDRIERHYAAVGKPTRVAIASGFVASAGLRVLERRGYAPEGGHGVLVYLYDRPRPPDMPDVAGLSIERVGPDLAKVYSRTGYESFRERGPQFVTIIEALVRSRRRGLRAFLGRIDGEPAATGMLIDTRPICGLGNGSVRPAFRGRGLQKALITHRIRDGWRRGYRYFFGETENPASAHNMEELGWRLLYEERDWVRTS